MEQKRKLKQPTIEDQINELWKSNPKIPFMQSKEILAFGYTEGRKSINDKTQTVVQSMEESVNDESFAGTTQEFFEHIEKETTKRQSDDKKNKIELKIEEARLKLLDELEDFITDKRDLIETYNKVKNMRSASEKQLRTLRDKYERK